MYQIKVEELQKKPLFIASPHYGFQCNSVFVSSFGELMANIGTMGISCDGSILPNDAYIPHARNSLIAAFLASKAKHLLFIDSDIGFNPMNVFEMLAWQDDEYPILSAAYKIKTPDMKHYAFRPLPSGFDQEAKKPVEVESLGTGFTLIKRSVFEQLILRYPHQIYKDEGSDEIRWEFFRTEVDPKSLHYVSEDYWFCRRARAIGLKSFICPWMRLQHVGPYIYT